MELAQAKIPYLPPEWTLARAAKYAAKLGVFILVPGLHQIACKRWILGSLLLILYVVSEFVGLNSPFEIMYVDLTPYSLFDNLSEVAQNISWLLLAFDLKNLERRYLTPGHLLPAACVAVLSYMPFHDNRILYYSCRTGEHRLSGILQARHRRVGLPRFRRRESLDRRLRRPRWF